MGKKMKLVLDDLKVQSFVTSLDEKNEKLVKAGGDPFTETNCLECPTTTEVGETCETCFNTCAGCPTDVQYTCGWTMCNTCPTDCTCPLATC